jgi:hypothetical protein
MDSFCAAKYADGERSEQSMADWRASPEGKAAAEAAREREACAAEANEMAKVMAKKLSRGDLEPGVCYLKHTGTLTSPMGKFIRSYRQGSGDGMEIVCVFETGEFRDEMWGGAGVELSYFTKA